MQAQYYSHLGTSLDWWSCLSDSWLVFRVSRLLCIHVVIVLPVHLHCAWILSITFVEYNKLKLLQIGFCTVSKIVNKISTFSIFPVKLGPQWPIFLSSGIGRATVTWDIETFLPRSNCCLSAFTVFCHLRFSWTQENPASHWEDWWGFHGASAESQAAH